MGSARTGGRVSPERAATTRQIRRPRDDKRVLTLITVPIVISTVMATVGAALAPTLLAESPLGLIALNARTEYLLLVAPRLSLAVFVAVGSVRWFASSILFFLLGYRYGEAVVRWAETKVGGRVVRVAERLVRRASWLVVLVSPNAAVSLVAGAAGMTLWSYVLIAAVGTLGRTVLIHVLGRVFTDPIHDVTDVVIRYRWPLTAVSVVVVVVLVVRHRRRGTSHLETPDEIEEEIEDLEAELT